ITAAAYDGSQALDGGDDLSGGDGFVDTLTLGGLSVETNGTDITNWETIVVDGGSFSVTDGEVSVGSAPSTGFVVTNGAIFEGGDALAILGNLSIDSSSSFIGTGAGSGVYSVTGNVINDGVITTQDGVVGDTFTVSGNYSGGGSLIVDIDTSNDTADTLLVTGDATGTTIVSVNNLTPSNGTGNDLTIVTVEGASDPDAFVLAGGNFTVGAFDYGLEFLDGSFVLEAGSVANATGATYEAASNALGWINHLPTLEQRVGQRQWAGKELARDQIEPSDGIWIRAHGDQLDITASTGTAIDRSSWGLQAGIDLEVDENDDGTMVLGLTAQYATQDASARNSLGFGNIDSEAYGVGLTATWYGDSGTYFDIQGQANWISSDFFSSLAGELAQDETTRAYAASLEVGRRFETSQNGTLVPQAQLVWGNLDGASFVDNANNTVDLGNQSSLEGRIGIAYEFENNDEASGDREKYYVIGNVLHRFSDDNSAEVLGVSLDSSLPSTWAEVGVGGSLTVDENKTFYGEASYRTSLDGGFGDNRGLSFTTGFRLQW
uniref:autotransporter outer membrane beta-barrel domain-containing protein n=1 Tax=uncultured Erythrobacter sp. TaxID=263913 RepID=UPI0026019600